MNRGQTAERSDLVCWSTWSAWFETTFTENFAQLFLCLLQLSGRCMGLRFLTPGDLAALQPHGRQRLHQLRHNQARREIFRKTLRHRRQD
jgi:hypothetical protein